MKLSQKRKVLKTMLCDCIIVDAETILSLHTHNGKKVSKLVNSLQLFIDANITMIEILMNIHYLIQ
jgi:hypothetical protein